MYHRRIIIFLLIFYRLSIFGQVDPLVYTNKLWKEYTLAKNDSIKIGKLFDIAAYYHDYLEQNKYADSVSQMAIQIAQTEHRPELLLYAYNRYIESNDLYQNYQKALNYALISEQLATESNNPEMVFNSYKNLFTVYLEGFEFDKALEFSYKALSYAASTDNIKLKVESYLNIGRSLDGKNQKIEAFRNYLNAISLAERIKNTKLQIECCAQLSKYYNMNKLYVKSIHYKLKQSDLLKTLSPVDSVAIMWTVYDMQEIDINSNNNRLNEKSIQGILDFAKRWKNKRLLNYEIALVRSHLIAADKIDVLRGFYYKQFPTELKEMEIENPLLYFRLKAFFAESENKPDSALHYFNQAEKLLQLDPNKILQSNFYYRYGQFLKRRDIKSLAIEKFSKSFELASEASYFDFMINASKQLESLYADKLDYKNAYKYASLNKILADSVNNMSKKDQLLAMEIDHETIARKQAEEHEKEAQMKRYYLQYSAIIIFIICVFIVLLMLGSLRVPVWIIKMLGFFAFILLFEFITLIADHKIHDFTHGEPWKILFIKIFLIAMLLPMHHWVEKKVIAFLLHPDMINLRHYPLKAKIREHMDRLIGKADG